MNETKLIEYLIINHFNKAIKSFDMEGENIVKNFSYNINAFVILSDDVNIDLTIKNSGKENDVTVEVNGKLKILFDTSTGA